MREGKMLIAEMKEILKSVTVNDRGHIVYGPEEFWGNITQFADAGLIRVHWVKNSYNDRIITIY
jgi:hypothetical protein